MSHISYESSLKRTVRLGRGQEKMKRIVVDSTEGEMSFDEALERARWEVSRVKGISPSETTILAWYDRRSHRSHPEVGCSEGKVVNWAGCAVEEGADTLVDLEGGMYIFLCGSSRKH